MTPILLLAGLLLLAANAVFVAAEFSLVAARRTRMQRLADEGRAAAGTALTLMADLPRTLAATQLGITMASIGLGLTAEAAMEASVIPVVEHSLPLPDPLVQVVSGVLAVGVVVAAHTVLGEIVPKNLSIAAPERGALLLGPALRPFAVAVRPVVGVLSGMANVLLRIVGLEPRSELADAHGTEEIGDMLRLAAREGAIHRAEHELLERALRFAEIDAEAVMIPWDRVVSVPATASPGEAERLLLASDHRRLPVVDDDQVRGFVDILDLQRPTPVIPLHSVLQVSRTRRLVEVFDELRHGSGRLAIVTDEDRRAIGMLTIEDLLAELLG